MKLHVSLLKLPLALLALLAAATSVRAVDYYVSASLGNDSNDGLAATVGGGHGPLLTIQAAANKLTGSAVSNRIFIRTGTYAETVTLPPGVAINFSTALTIESYNNENVTITGADPVVNGTWANESGGVWSRTDATFPSDTAPSSPFDANIVWGDGMQVFRDNVMKPEARWPNNAAGTFPFQDSQLPHAGNTQVGDWSYVDSASTTGSGANEVITFVDAEFNIAYPNRSFLATQPFARVHTMSGLAWVMKNPQVSASSGTSVVTTQKVSEGENYVIKAGNAFYLAGKKEFMDADGEWFYDYAAHKLYYYTGGSAPTNVTVKKRNFGFDIAGRRYVTIQWLKFQACTIKTYDQSAPAGAMTNLAAQCAFKYLTMTYPQHNQLQKEIQSDYSRSGLVLGSYCTLSNSNLSYASNRMIAIMGTSVTITKNNIHHSGYIPHWPAMVEANIKGDAGGQYVEKAYISQNTLSDAGRAAMGYPGRAALIEYNDISKAMTMASDGAAVYWAQSDSLNSVVRYNRIHDCIAPWGSFARGFYVDSLNSGWIFHHNIIWNISGTSATTGNDTGVAVHINPRSNYGRMFNNTFYNCGAGLLTNQGDVFFGDGPTNMKIYNNIFHNPPPAPPATAKLIIGNYALWGESDLRNNHYGDPLFESEGTYDLRLKVNSPAKDQGLIIPGVTSGTPNPPIAVAGSAPDLGALEYATTGMTDWKTLAGHTGTALPTANDSYAENYEAAGSTDAEYPNLLKDGSFESGSLSSPWSVTGNVSLNNVNTAWSVNSARSGYYSAMFGAGASTVSQTVTNLEPGKRYKFTCGVMNTDYQNGSGSTVTLKVSVSGYPDFVGMMDTGTSAWVWNAQQPSEGMMVELPFINGSGTTATVKVEVQRPGGATNAPTANPPTGVYVDDLAVVLAEDNTDPQPYAMPKAAYSFNESSSPAYSTTVPASSYQLTLTGATLTGGLSGNALTLTSSTNKATTTNLVVPSSGIAESFTLSFWWKPASAPPTSSLTIASNCAFRDHTGAPPSVTWTVNNEAGWAMQDIVSQSVRAVRFSLCNGSDDLNEYQFVDIKNPSTTKFSHIAVTVDRGRKVIMTYLDGQLHGISKLKSPLFDDVDFGPAGNNLRFGSAYSEAAIGQIDDFQAWAGVLTGQQIDNIYLAGDPVASTVPVPVHRLKFDEGTGATTMWDASGNKHHATITSGSGASVATGGKIGNALAFNSASTTAAIVAGGSGGSGLHVPKDATSPFTVAFWINMPATVGTTDKIATNDGGTWAAKGWNILPNNATSLRFYLKSVTNQGKYAQLTGLTSGTWMHVAFVVTQPNTTSTTVTMYVNGAQSGTPYQPAVAFDVSTDYGLRLGGGGCNAKIDDFRLYGEALTAQDVLDLYKQLDRPPY